MSKKTAKIAATYFITIIASLLIIGGAGYFLLKPYLTNSAQGDMSAIRPEGTELVTSAAQEEYVPTYEDSRNVLVVYEAEKRSSAVCFVLAGFVPAENKLVVVPLQSDICTTVDGKSNTLYEFYRLGGAEGAKKAVAAMSGIKIDKYLKFTQDSFTSFSDFMGNVEYDIPYNLVYENEATGESTILKGGSQILDSVSLRKVLTYPNYKGGEEYRAKVVGTIGAALINSGSAGLLKSSLDTVFTDVINSDIETDITGYDYDESKPAIEYVLSNTDSPAQIVIPSGVYNENNCYVLDENFIKALPRWLSIEE